MSKTNPLEAAEAVEEPVSNPEELSPPEETALIPEGAVQDAVSGDETELREVKSLVEAIIYITDEPLSAQQIAAAMERPLELVQKVLDMLVEEYDQPDRGLTVRELAGGYKMGTKPEHHEALKAFVKGLKPSLKLSLAALETLAVIAYKQPITGPEIMEIRGVQGAGVLKTLLDRKLIANAGRKAVVGKPMLYKTTKEFLLQFGLNTLTELPTLKEFEELRRMALSDDDDVLGGDAPAATPEDNEAAAADALAATKDGVPAETTATPEEEKPAEDA
jgi:segregation and condensation protein B